MMARGAMAPGPQGPVSRGARLVNPRMGGAAPAPVQDVFASLTPGADALMARLDNIQTDPNSMRSLAERMDGLSPEIGQTFRQGVQMLLATPPGPREAMQKLQTYFGLKPTEIDICAKMLGLRRADIAENDAGSRRNRMLAVAAVALFAKAQALAILGIERSDQKLHRNCTQALRADMARGDLHAQLVLYFMKGTRPGMPMM
jgi:hypothetical protein